MSHSEPVLVVLVNNRRDWQRIVDEHWYRIPLRSAPQPVAAHYLAFYLTRIFGAERWQVRYYAPALRYEIVRRDELLPAEAAHPRAQQRYYRVTLGPLQQLPAPIPSQRLRRISFIPTTFERLCSAAELTELWQADDTLELLWDAFPDAALKAQRRLPLEP